MSPGGGLLHRGLRLLPTAIAVFWVIGVARFHGLLLQPLDFALLIAAAIAMQWLLARRRGSERPVPLPPQANPIAIAMVAAGIVGALALLIGGLVEFAVPAGEPAAAMPLWLRTLWHGACAFAAAYCRILARYLPRGDPAPGS